MISDEQRAHLLDVINWRKPSPNLTTAETQALRNHVESGREDDAWAYLVAKANAQIVKSFTEESRARAESSERTRRERELHEAQMAAALGKTDEYLMSKREVILRHRARLNSLDALGVRQRSMAVQTQAADMALADGMPEKTREYAIALDPELHRATTERAELEYQKLTGQHPTKPWQEPKRTVKASSRVVINNTKKRRHPLDDAIDRAVDKHGFVPASIWATLIDWATSKEKPFVGLVGITDDGILYRGPKYQLTLDDDILTRRQLSERIRKRKIAASKPL